MDLFLDDQISNQLIDIARLFISCVGIVPGEKRGLEWAE